VALALILMDASCAKRHRLLDVPNKVLWENIPILILHQAHPVTSQNIIR
jgi:hypothetical protein